MFNRFIILISLNFLFLNQVIFAETNIVNEQLELNLYSEFQQLKPGQDFKLAIQFKLKPDWHIYWKNPGDTGLPTKFEWDLPKEVQLSKIDWPIPKRIETQILTNFGYENTATFIANLKLASTYLNKSVPISLKISWLVCYDICIPQEANFNYEILVESEAKINPLSKHVFESAYNSLPENINLIGNLMEERDKTYLLSINIKPLMNKIDLSQVSFDLIVDQPSLIKASSKHNFEISSSEVFIYAMRASKNISRDLSGLFFIYAGNNVIAYPVQFNVEKKAITAKLPEKIKTNLIYLCFLAFIGGLILNIMPCVFPVLAIKVLSLLELAKANRKEINLHVLSYTLGILCSINLLALLLIIFKKSGQILGWGFQLQNPTVIIILAVVFFIFALVLLFDLEFGNKLSRLDHLLPVNSGALGSFFTGILTTITATPCTGPFMGYALGIALLLSTFETFIIFTSLALGLAAPFIVLVLFPKLLNLLPKPGRWLKVFRQIMSIPIFATVIWLGWVYWQQHLAENTKILSDQSYQDSYGLKWQIFSPGLAESVAEQNNLAYVDYTASWCLTCQLNKRLVFGSKLIQDYINENKVILIRADWTNRNEIIAEELAKFNRNSVPLNLIYYPNNPNNPIILPSILTASKVLKEFKKASETK